MRFFLQFVTTAACVKGPKTALRHSASQDRVKQHIHPPKGPVILAPTQSAFDCIAQIFRAHQIKHKRDRRFEGQFDHIDHNTRLKL